MTCPCCHMQLPDGSQFCPNCHANFVPQNAPMMNPYPVKKPASPDRLLKFYRSCYRVYRLIPLISTIIAIASCLLAGIIVAIAAEEPIFILISLFGPVFAVLNFFVISVLISEKIARTDATIEMLELYKKQLKGEKI